MESFKSEVLPTSSPELFAEAVERCAALLKSGEIVALPTETVYGLAACATNSQAVEKIFRAKGRPSHNPIILHVSSLAMARQCALRWTPLADRLADAFWPGPLTLVLPKAPGIPDIVTAGGPTVGIRWPSHPFMQAVIAACGFPLAAPSANLSNQVSGTTAGHVRLSMGDKIRLIVDGGPAQVGIESTVLDISGETPCILRPGMIDAASILSITGSLAGAQSTGDKPLKSPGMLKKHYAPRAKLLLWHWESAESLRHQIQALREEPARIHILACSVVPEAGGGLGPITVMPQEPAAFARALYSQLHHCDAAGARYIIVEQPPHTDSWRAINDRLKRASAV